MPRLERPSAISWRTSCSRAVSASTQSWPAVEPSSRLTTSGSTTVPPPTIVRTAATSASPVGDPLLEEVAGRATGRQSAHGQCRAGIHRQQQHADRRALGAQLLEYAHPLVAVVGRHPDVEDQPSASGSSASAACSAGDVRCQRPPRRIRRPPAAAGPLRGRARRRRRRSPGAVDAHRSTSGTRASRARCVRSCRRDPRRARAGRPEPRPGPPGPAVRCRRRRAGRRRGRRR